MLLTRTYPRQRRGFFKASDWELEDAEEEDVEIIVNHSPKEFLVEDGKLVGIVSIGDLVQSQLSHYERQVNELTGYVAGSTA